MSLQSTNDFQNEIKNKTFPVKMSFTGMKISPRPEVSGYFSIRNFFFPGTASVHTYPKNPAYESTTFWIRSPEWKFLITLWIRNRVDAKSGYFFVRRRNKIESSSLLWIPRRMLCCQYSQRSPWYESESGFVSDTCGWANLIWMRIRVDVEICESGKK